jgi:hypothetical protein
MLASVIGGPRWRTVGILRTRCVLSGHTLLGRCVSRKPARSQHKSGKFSGLWGPHLPRATCWDVSSYLKIANDHELSAQFSGKTDA